MKKAVKSAFSKAFVGDCIHCESYGTDFYQSIFLLVKQTGGASETERK